MTEDWRIAVLALLVALAPAVICNGGEQDAPVGGSTLESPATPLEPGARKDLVTGLAVQ